MTIQCKTFLPTASIPEGAIFPQQSHGAKIVEVVTGDEDLTDCDGLWTRFSTPPDKGDLGDLWSTSKTPPSLPFSGEAPLLGVKTADCAPICVWDETKYGVLHAGWRGLVNGAVEPMLEVFETGSHPPEKGELKGISGLNVWVGPLLPAFEIQRDECYQKLYAKFGNQFFSEIKVDLKSLKVRENNAKAESRSTLIFEFKKCLASLLPEQAVFDERSTWEEVGLASWRRDKSFPNGQNSTVIGPESLIPV